MFVAKGCEADSAIFHNHNRLDEFDKIASSCSAIEVLHGSHVAWQEQ